ncbi:putative transcriptional regulatory protein, partial [Neolecta irregularis DAH-3]
DQLLDRLREAEAELARLQSEAQENSTDIAGLREIAQLPATIHGAVRSTDKQDFQSTEDFPSLLPLLPEPIRQLIPTPEISDLFLRRFIDTIPEVLVYIHIPTFLGEHLAFWNRYVDTAPNVMIQPGRPFWISILLAVYCATLRTFIREDDLGLQPLLKYYKRPLLQLRKELQDGLMESLRHGKYIENYDMDVMQVHCVNQLNVDIIPPPMIWTHSGLMVRMAHALSLPRDPVQFGLSPLACEIRRRMWTVIRIYESATSWHEGLPSRIRKDDLDCPGPSYNADLDGNEPRIRDRMKWVVYQCQIALFLPDMYALAYSHSPPTHEGILVLDSSFRELEAEIKIALHLSFNDPDPRVFFQALLMEYAISRILMCLNVPFAHKRYPYSRERCLEGARRTLQMIIAFETRSQEIEKFRWYGQTWMMTSPLLATILLLIDLIKYELEDQASWELVNRAYIAMEALPELQTSSIYQQALCLICRIKDLKILDDGSMEELDVFSKVETLSWPWLKVYIHNNLKDGNNSDHGP